MLWLGADAAADLVLVFGEAEEINHAVGVVLHVARAQVKREAVGRGEPELLLDGQRLDHHVVLRDEPL